ncbi:MarR family transcriptional regulator [Bacillus sp. SA1-12]|uniref:MarR family transcriptional regulator n=1 Tax=Bacillus sp. SA1-12 TaxID=1455638 RepID=UPI000698AA5A|nr:MarR family transcriptional regulator [Bacillus sp. SA1-12]
MSDSYPFNTYSGLLTPEHYKRIGNAIWLFLWCISSTTAEKEKDGIMWGIVLGNTPQKLPDLAKVFGVNQKTISRWIDQLEKEGYIKITRAPYGLIFTVKNSKKFKNRSDKNVLSEMNRDQTKMSDQTELSDPVRSDKSVRSNKDITELDITIKNNNAAVNIAHGIDEQTGGVPTTEIVQLADADQSKGQIPGSSPSAYEQIKEKYMRLTGIGGFDVNAKDKHSIQKLLEYNIDLDKALIWLEECFRDYKPKHQFDKINSFAYCLPIILDKHVAEQEGTKENTPMLKRKASYYNKKPIRKEIVPDWLGKEQNQPKSEMTPEEIVAFEEQKRKLFNRINNYKKQKSG